MHLAMPPCMLLYSSPAQLRCCCRAAIGSENEDGSKKFVIRPYTPTSPKDAQGYFDLVVKVYEQGKMSKHFGELKVCCHCVVIVGSWRDAYGFRCILCCSCQETCGRWSSLCHTVQEGDEVEMKGPIPKFAYKPNMKKHIGMVRSQS